VKNRQTVVTVERTEHKELPRFADEHNSDKLCRLNCVQ